MIAIIPPVRNIPCLDCGGGRARSVTNSLDKYHSNAASRVSVTADRRISLLQLASTENVWSEVKVKFYFVTVVGLVNTSRMSFPQIHRL